MQYCLVLLGSGLYSEVVLILRWPLCEVPLSLQYVYASESSPYVYPTVTNYQISGISKCCFPILYLSSSDDENR